MIIVAILVGTLLAGLLVVGTAALSGHPLSVIVAALLVGCALLAAMRRGRRGSDGGEST